MVKIPISDKVKRFYKKRGVVEVKALVLAIGLLLGIVQMCVAEEYLYWYVDQTNLPEEDRVPFDVMMLNVYEEKDGVRSKVDIPEDVWTNDGWLFVFDNPISGTLVDTACHTRIGEYADKEGGPSYYYQLELWNTFVDENDPVWTSKLLVSYESLVESRMDPEDLQHLSPFPWNATGPAPIPEPTGGMMVLFGLAVLGLRRRCV